FTLRQQWPNYRKRLRAELPNVSSGSKCEILAASRCLPLYPQNRTSLNAVGMSVSCQYLTYTSMLLHVRRWLNQKRLRLDLVHEDDWNSMRCFAFFGKANPCAPVS